MGTEHQGIVKERTRKAAVSHTVALRSILSSDWRMIDLTSASGWGGERRGQRHVL